MPPKKACWRQKDDLVQCVLESQCVLEKAAKTVDECVHISECALARSAYVQCRVYSLSPSKRLRGNLYENRSGPERRIDDRSAALEEYKQLLGGNK